MGNGWASMKSVCAGENVQTQNGERRVVERRVKDLEVRLSGLSSASSRAQADHAARLQVGHALRDDISCECLSYPCDSVPHQQPRHWKCAKQKWPSFLETGTVNPKEGIVGA